MSSTNEEKKSDDNYRTNAAKTEKDDGSGRLVIEAIDRIIAIRSLVMSSQQSQTQQTITDNCNAMLQLQSSVASLRQEHAHIVAQHPHTFMECGLLDIDRFIDSSGTNESSYLLLQQYTKLRDVIRRHAHQNAMLHRQNSLLDLLSLSAASASANADNSTRTARVAEVNNVHRTLSIIRKFVYKYRSNIGSHSFLAGLHRLVELQLRPKSSPANACRSSNDPFYIVRWRFNGSVLTEACRPNNYGKNNMKDENDDGNDLAYTHDAIEVLFSFLIRIVDDIDIESGQVGSTVPIIDEADDNMGFDDSSTKELLSSELILSFEIDKHISNNTLQRIFAILPDPKCLDARATGQVEVVEDASSSVDEMGVTRNQHLVPRQNVNGEEDEQWPWFSRLEFCIVL